MIKGKLLDRIRFEIKGMEIIEFCEHITKEKVNQSLLEESMCIAIPDNFRKALYILIRLLKPNIVVETGVYKGASTDAILRAMDKNNFGHLYSIELPVVGLLQDKQFISDIEIGMLVSESIRNRWTLLLGDSKIELPKLVEKIGNFDIFFHDSLHTYEHMKFEFELAKKYSKVIMSHDIACNDAFPELVKGKDYSVLKRENLGVVSLQKILPHQKR